MLGTLEKSTSSLATPGRKWTGKQFDFNQQETPTLQS